jgi:exosortase/archaeosortase family protein
VSTDRLRRIDLAKVAFAAGLIVLAAGPVVWLVGTWIDPAFDSHGLMYFGVVAALAAWSASSRQVDRTPRDERFAIGLLCAAAIVRFVGQVLAIDTIGALALVIDVYALARLAGLGRRARALSPLWLAAAFAFALPLERIVQRSIGYPLQEMSAAGACGMLGALFGDVRCTGVHIGVGGADVLVDLPCSGARALIVFGFAFAVTAALTRPGLRAGLIGAAIALAAAVAGNLVRITMLASGVALGPARLGFDVMMQPWHDIVGLISLGLAAPALYLWARSVRPNATASSRRAAAAPPRLRAAPAWGAAAFLLLAVAIVSAPRRALDVAPREVSIAAPARIGDAAAIALPLSERERAYFEQYGGAAAKAAYGPFALMLARTTSPLRHLHAPDECLRGLGYRVEYLGMSFTPLPTAHYRAVAGGAAYRVDVSFIPDRGAPVASVSEAVWRWLGDRSSVWTSVQRIAPEGVDPAARAAFEAGVLAALDLSGPQAARTASLEGEMHAH